MGTIERVELFQVDLTPPKPRSDAIQAFVRQETPIVRITCADGAQGTGYAYTIGTGGSSVLALLRDHLAEAITLNADRYIFAFSFLMLSVIDLLLSSLSQV